MNKTISLFVFTILITSLFSFIPSHSTTFADNVVLDDQNKFLNQNENTSFQLITNNKKISLNESLHINSNENQNENTSNNLIEKPKISSIKKIELFEKVEISLNEVVEYTGSLKQNPKKIAIMDRILEKKSSKQIFDLHNENSKLSFNDLEENKILDDNDIFTLFNFDKLKLVWSFDNDQFVTNNFISSELIPNSEFDNIDDLLFSLDSPIILIFSLPIIGYIFLRTDNKNLNHKNIKQITCFFFVILLSSTAVVTPFSISSSYWGIAYAEEFSFDGIIEDSKNDSMIINSTSTEPIIASNSTEPIIASNSTEPIIASNSTEPIIASNSTEPIIASNSTEPIIESNSTEPIIASNSTEPIIPKIIVPDATVTFQFDEPPTESNSTELKSPTLELDGQDTFVQIQNVTVTDDVDGLTVTAWVKPEFSSGSAEFTVVSKDKSFSLTISNNIQSENTAKFSVFDGIKWTSVESTSTITEDWSFLSSTFSGEHIAIFVNGTKETTKDVVGIPTLVENGQLEVIPVEKISSKEDIVIGATVVIKEDKIKSNNKFSGKLDNISLYDYVLDDEQIFAMYEQTKDIYAAMVVPELTLEEIIAQMELELLTNTNSTVIPTNSTVIPTNSTVIPTNSTVIPTNSTVIPTNSTVIP
ncbi:MAG: LamG domain-containing protein, partial [Candidatus Nitrosopumilus sp. bin_6a]